MSNMIIEPFKPHQKLYDNDGKLTKQGALVSVAQGRTVLVPLKEPNGKQLCGEIRTRESILGSGYFAGTNPAEALNEIDMKMSELAEARKLIESRTANAEGGKGKGKGN